MKKDILAKVFVDKKILITGGLGFIGSNLAIELVKLGGQVTLLDAMIPGYGGNPFNIEEIKDKVKVYIVDMRDGIKMAPIVKGKDYIFNMAGSLSHIDSMIDPFTDLEINGRAQLSLLEACRKNNRKAKIIFAGTRGQYGRARHLPVDETHPLCPTDINGINNIAGELYHIVYNNLYDIRAVSLRLTNTYGPRHQMKHSRQGFLNWFIRLALDNKIMDIYGKGKQLRDFNYIDDVVRALLTVAASDKSNRGVFNLGSGKPISVAEAAKLVIKLTGSSRYRYIDFPENKEKIEVGNYYANFSKIKKTLGWKPEVSLEDGIKRTIDFYRKNKRHYW